MYEYEFSGKVMIPTPIGEVDLNSISGVNVKSFGAKGNGLADDTQAIKNAISKTEVGDTLRIPKGDYLITDTIVIDKKIHVLIDGNIIYGGVRDRSALYFKRPVGQTIQINGQIQDKTGGWRGWINPDYVGITFENAFRCDIFIKFVRNFTTGVRVMSSIGQSFGHFFNTYTIKQLLDNKIGLEFYMKDASSWINSNIFNDVFFSLTQSGTEFQTANVDRYAIKQTNIEGNTISADSNIFNDVRFDIGTSLGGTYTCVNLSRAWGWKFNNYRVELVAGTNVKFADLDLVHNAIRGIDFLPMFETYTSQANVSVNLLNATQGTKSYDEIYKKIGVGDNQTKYLIHEDKDFHTRFRKPTTNFNYIENLYRYLITGETLDGNGEKVSEYSTSDLIIENGVFLDRFYSGVVYLKNVKKGDIVNIRLKKASSINNNLEINVKPFDVAGNIIPLNEITDSEVIYKAIASGNSYWDNTNKRISQSVPRGYQSFTINRDEVKTVAVLFNGDVNGLAIESNNREISILKSIIPVRNNCKHHIQTASPTLKTDGKYLAGDVVYNSNTAVGQHIGWQLLDTSFAGTGTLAWVSLGKY